MKIVHVKSLASTIVLSLWLVACSESIEGTYKVIGGPREGITVTLGQDTFAFSSGASGTYEVSGDNVIFSGMTFTGTMKIEGADLVNEEWRFNKE